MIVPVSSEFPASISSSDVDELDSQRRIWKLKRPSLWGLLGDESIRDPLVLILVTLGRNSPETLRSPSPPLLPPPPLLLLLLPEVGGGGLRESSEGLEEELLLLLESAGPRLRSWWSAASGLGLVRSRNPGGATARFPFEEVEVEVEMEDLLPPLPA